MEHESEPRVIVAAYREYAPRPELREHVRALFWFGPSRGESRHDRVPRRQFHFSSADIFFSPVFADAHASVVFDLGHRYDSARGWCAASRGWDATIMGAITSAGAAPRMEPPAMLGVYLRSRGCSELFALPALELTDRVVPLTDVWRQSTVERMLIDSGGAELHSLRVVEEELMRRLLVSRAQDAAVHVANMAALVRRREGRVTVSELCDRAGLSRQHLGRLFRQHIGVSPKLYARLTRFRAALSRAAHPRRLPWTQLSLELGYVDQSHLIAEFREFSSFTPEQVASGRRFHPFLGDSTPG